MKIKYKLFVLLLMVCMGRTYSQSTDQNYVHLKVYRDANGSLYFDIFQYYDAIGRLQQTVQKGILPAGKDLVVLEEYDVAGRGAKTWLPVASSTNGAFVSPVEVKKPQGIYNFDSKSYSEKIYEASPLERERERFGPGQAWYSNGKSVKTRYVINNTSDSLTCMAFTVSGKGMKTSLVKVSSCYPSGEIFVTREEQEDGHVRYIFENKGGQTILTREITVTANGVKKMLDTYMVYDNSGNLCYVLSPLAIEQPTGNLWTDESANIKDCAYVYKYDEFNRCIAKRFPGQDWVYQVYDRNGRYVMNQDGRLRAENKWLYYVYDNFDRLIEQSIVIGDLSRDSIQARYDKVDFDNSFPCLGDACDIHKPFFDNSFTVSEVLSSTVYGNTRCKLGNVERNTVSKEQYLCFHANYWIGQGYLCSMLPDLDYLLDDDTVNPIYYICTDPSDPDLKYYYIPEKYVEYIPIIIDNDATQSFEVRYDFPGDGNPLDEILSVHGEKYEPLEIPARFSFLEIPTVVGSGDRVENRNNFKSYEKVLVLDGRSNFVERYFYYDYKGRLIQVVEGNHLEGISRVSYKYDFAGNVLKMQESHDTGTGTPIVTLLTSREFDHGSRMMRETIMLNNSLLVDVDYLYDELGRLSSKKYKCGSKVLEENMTYNLRGWLTSKSSSAFNMQLMYETTEAGNVKRYDGSISEWVWQHGTGERLMYGFKYDMMNQLTDAIAYKKNGTSWISNVNGYVEKGITYDPNGNILGLQRTANGTLVDNLVYSYKGNQLMGLTENVSGMIAGDIYNRGTVATGNYAYDKNGNMITDSRKSLEITYNYLNLLHEVKKGGIMQAKYTYLADGTKSRVRDGTETNGFDYLGSFVYKKSSVGIQLETVNFSDGVIRVTGSNSAQSEVNYFLTDHLGSVRVIVDGNGVVKERNDYYPFGARHVKGDYPKSDNRLLYNGKEEQVTGNLNYLDYGARMYDVGLGRWFGMDPMAQHYYSISPYVYCGNNPINRIDPTGMIWDDPEKAENLKKNIDKKIESLGKDIAKNQAKLDKGGLKEKNIARLNNKISEANARVSNLKTSKGDIDKLGMDLNNTYTFSFISGGEHHVYQGSDAKIYIETSSDALSIHEITHVRQSLDAGGLKFSSNGQLLNAGSVVPASQRYEQMSMMEVEAYKMQYSYDQSFPGNTGVKGIQGINVHSVGNIRNSAIGIQYPFIKTYSDFLLERQKMLNR